MVTTRVVQVCVRCTTWYIGMGKTPRPRATRTMGLAWAQGGKIDGVALGAGTNRITLAQRAETGSR